MMTPEEKKTRKAAYSKGYYQANRATLLEQSKRYRRKNKATIAEKMKQYRLDNLATITERKKQRYQKNRATVLERALQYYRTNRAKIAKRNKRRYQENRTTILEQKKQYTKSDHYKHHHLKREYGITLAQYNTLLDTQHFCCSLCHTPDYTGGKSLHVDHCHETGVIRSLLCSKCNTAIGLLQDNPALLKKAAAYVAAYRTDYELPG